MTKIENRIKCPACSKRSVTEQTCHNGFQAVASLHCCPHEDCLATLLVVSSISRPGKVLTSLVDEEIMQQDDVDRKRLHLSWMLGCIMGDGGMKGRTYLGLSGQGKIDAQSINKSLGVDTLMPAEEDVERIIASENRLVADKITKEEVAATLEEDFKCLNGGKFPWEG